eukprot:1322589-Pyramimonas_sp.AAC.1
MASADATGDPLWSRALAPEHRRSPPLPTEERLARKEGRSDLVGQPLAGDLFTDGSVLDPSLVSARGGWAAVVMGRDEEALSIFGPLLWPCPQESGAAELAAAIEGLQGCPPPVRIYTDCRLLVDGFAAGKTRCLQWQRPHQELWVRLWRALEDIGPDNVT